MPRNTIPDIVDSLGKHWSQPNKSLIEVKSQWALMPQVVLDQLPEYSSSVPSGVYVGKMWKRDDGEGGWWLCWYGEHSDPDTCSINKRRILVEEEQWIIK